MTLIALLRQAPMSVVFAYIVNSRVARRENVLSTDVRSDQVLLYSVKGKRGVPHMLEKQTKETITTCIKQSQ